MPDQDYNIGNGLTPVDPEEKVISAPRYEAVEALTVADLLTIFNHGRIGEIEFRNWLAELYPSFARARRADVDEWLEEQGAKIAARQAEEEEYSDIDDLNEDGE